MSLRVVTMFFNMVFWWWWEFRLNDIEAWTFHIYLFVVIYALVFYLACALLSPEDLFAHMVKIEDLAGRVRDTEKWGPRVLDLDLLLYGKNKIQTAELTVPHPGLHERDFVIIPLAEIAGNLNIPGHGLLSTLINQVENHSLKKVITGQ